MVVLSAAVRRHMQKHEPGTGAKHILGLNPSLGLRTLLELQ